MENSKNLIGKLNNMALIFMFITMIIGIWVPVCNKISIFCCCIIYICTFLETQKRTGKINIFLAILCIALVVWMIARNCFYFKYATAMNYFFIYAYIIASNKALTGKWNKMFIGIGIVGILGNGLYTYTQSKWMSYIVLLLQIVILLRFLDPILEKVALKHREKRLMEEASGETKRTSKKQEMKDLINNISKEIK